MSHVVSSRKVNPDFDAAMWAFHYQDRTGVPPTDLQVLQAAGDALPSSARTLVLRGYAQDENEAERGSTSRFPH